MDTPPSARITCPLTKLAAGEARRRAMGEGVCGRGAKRGHFRIGSYP